MKLALDKKSARRIDGNGHLIVEKTTITKAAVNPYYGNEIPNYEELGLQPEAIYNLLRDPDELKNSMETFGGLQLLIKHIPVDASSPEKESTIGSVGTDLVMDGENIKTSLRIWDQEAIDLITSEKLRELSSGYTYVADMTPGEYKGVKYDGIMRNIHGNHVALVERGRIGRDAIIADSLPKLMEQSMKLKKGAMTKVGAKIKQRLGLDADISAEALKDIIEEVAGSIEPVVEGNEDDLEIKDEIRDEDDEDEEEIKEKISEDEEQTRADRDNESEAMRLREREKREEKDRNRDKREAAMDADTIRAQVMAEVNALFEAREAVKPLIGKVALDSAEAVYKMALDHAGVNTKGVHPSAFKAMAELVMQNKKSPAPSVAMDSASFEEDEYTKRFK